MRDSRVRVCAEWEGVRYYFLRFSGSGAGDDPEFVPGERVHQAALLSRDWAIVLAKKLNAKGWKTHVVTPEGVLLYDSATTLPPPPAPMADRTPMHVGDVLIVPGNPPRRGYFVRFPATNFESLWAETAADVYDKLLENPRASILLPLAEKYVAPPEPPAPEPIPTYRTRPGDQRR